MPWDVRGPTNSQLPRIQGQDPQEVNARQI